MAGRGRQETFLQAVRDCQWQRVGQLVLQGSSLEQRDVAVSQAVSHSQWALVSQLVQLGISQKCRDLAVHKAVRYCLWDIVEDLVAAGVSGEKRDFLLQRGLRQRQWALVSRLLSLGVGLELRDVVVTTALEHGQWGLVLDALRVGVKQELVTKVFQEVVSRKRWEHVPSLVKLCIDNDHTDFVLQEAIRSCQWVCVRQLIKTGLTPAQQGLVCREALEWAHFECAVELLRQGCEQGCAERIVLEAFRWRRCQDLIDILKEDGIESSLRDVVLCAAKRYGLWDEYLMIMKEIGATEEMADVITTALYSINVSVILRLLSMFTSARRVFKQVLLRTRFFDHDIITLHTCLMDDHPDLAFYMFTAQEMWEIVVSMFGDARLRTKDRRFALRHAVKKGAWYFVDAMVCDSSASHNDRRYAFLQAARQGQWPLALKLSTYSNTISVRDKLFAFQTWLKLGLWECVQDSLREWEQPLQGLFLPREGCPPSKKPFFKCVLEESVIVGNLEHFLEVCSAVHFDKNWVLFVLQTAIKFDKCEFVLEFCRQERSDEHLVAAVKLATQHKKWHLLKDLFTGRNKYADYIWGSSESFDLKLLWLCVENVSFEEDAWQIVVPALNEFCGTFTAPDTLYWDFHENRIEAEHVEGIQKLTEWCLVHAFWNAGLVFSVLADDEATLTRMTDNKTGEVGSDVFSFCVVLAVRSSNWASAAKCLEGLTYGDMENMVYGVLGEDDELYNLIDACTVRGQYEMAALIALWTQDWDGVEDNLPQCTDAEVIDSVVREASVSGQWDIVRDHLDRSSQDNCFLCDILQCAVEEGQSDICTRLLPKVDLLQARFSIRSLFYYAVASFGDRERMVKLCILFGLSTHVRPCDCSRDGYCVCRPSPFRTALRNGQLPLFKLLYKAGACSNRQLFRYKQDSEIRNKLEGQSRHDIVEYLDHSATTPRTLQDLCRLQVSHHIGCHPGRLERVMALDIPWPAKDLINFEDLLF